MQTRSMLARRRFTLLGGAAAGAALLPAAARAQAAAYPRSTIRIIIPFAPGGASDFIGRLLQPALSAHLGQAIVMENRGGAAGNIGMSAAARAEPDGYTVYLGNIGTIAINPAMFPDLNVNPQRDFIPVSLLAEVPGLLVANPNFPPSTVRELIDYARARPGQINFASPGSGSQNRLEMEMFRLKHGLDMVHVPYKGGAGPAVTDLLGGHVSLMFVTISSAMGHVREGRLKTLGVTTRERVEAIPNVPTMFEQGFPDNVSTGWQGLLVPTGTPAPVVAKLHAAAKAAVADEGARRKMLDAGVIPVASPTPDDFARYIAVETTRWAKAVADSGAKPD